MKAVVTGGAGFIGSKVVRILVEPDYDVVAVDNLSSGYIINLANFIKDGRVDFRGCRCIFGLA